MKERSIEIVNDVGARVIYLDSQAGLVIDGVRIFAKYDKKLYAVDNLGVETPLSLSAAASIITALIIGGSSPTQTLIYKPTTGVGVTGADHIFQVGNNGATEAMRILNNGRVGISTASPLTKLDVLGTTGVFSTTDKGIFSVTSDSSAGLFIGSFASSPFGMWIQGGTTSLGSSLAYPIIINPNAGDVGIGITTPLAKLHVGGVGTVAIFGDLTGDAVIQMAKSSNGTAYLNALSMSSTFTIGPTDTGVIKTEILGGGSSPNGLVILNNGNIGIGTTTPTAVIHLKAGTATVDTAPLKFTSGTLNTTPVAAQYEYNGNHYLTNTALLRYPVGGTLFNYFADVTQGGAEADIFSSTLLANTFSQNGDRITASYGGNFVTVGTELTQLLVKFDATGATTLWDSTSIAPATGTTSWRVCVELIRVSSTVVRYTVSLNTSGATEYVYCTSGELTGLTLSAGTILKLRGASSGVGSGSGDIVGKMGYVSFSPGN